MFLMFEQCFFCQINAFVCKIVEITVSAAVAKQFVAVSRKGGKFIDQ